MEPDARAGRLPPVTGAISLPVDSDEPVDTVEPVDAVMESTADHAFVGFYRAHRDRIARALALTIRDGHLAADAVDEAMARAYQRWAKVQTYDDPAAWVYRVALNWSTSVLRRRLRPMRAARAEHPADVGTIEEPSVLAALAALDVHQRAVVVCRYYLGLSEAETATALGIRPGTVKSRLHRGLRILEARLDHLRPEGSR